MNIRNKVSVFMFTETGCHKKYGYKMINVI
ncbi:hypothetical protein L667_21265 [Escherichia coli 95JB1]|nr:hypothetical protein L668_19930 [Escherichia coli 95NR1]ERD96886.1 hypothetical protein L667_21265 [Escherichia coli 95JB1]ETD62175.1 hypothetical protein Q458_19935 [Escherichia coli ATCC BAA-2209]ETJ67137.1 hypothetical protein O199_0221975 [Escherichia coli ATCC 35150]